MLGHVCYIVELCVGCPLYAGLCVLYSGTMCGGSDILKIKGVVFIVILITKRIDS